MFSEFEGRKRGRPPNPYVSIQVGIRIRQDLITQLDTCKNKTEVVNKALEMYFDMEGQSSQWLLKRREELKKELKGIESTITLKNQKEKEKKIQIEQDKLKQKNLAEIYEIAGTNRTEEELKMWSASRLRRVGISFDDFLNYYTERQV
ncbi:MAG: hypothetical protein KAJ44_01685 [Thermoplasmatales archaeon]|nr:hypothetical protein [Thermoplasmatales archaeon]